MAGIHGRGTDLRPQRPVEQGVGEEQRQRLPGVHVPGIDQPPSFQGTLPRVADAVEQVVVQQDGHVPVPLRHGTAYRGPEDVAEDRVGDVHVHRAERRRPGVDVHIAPPDTRLVLEERVQVEVDPGGRQVLAVPQNHDPAPERQRVRGAVAGHGVADLF